MCIRLAAATGARRGELVALQWSDFKGERMTIRRSLVESDDQLFERPTKTGGKGLLADTFDGDDGDTLRGDESGCSVFIERVVNWVAGASK